jgi:hypothetical protein
MDDYADKVDRDEKPTAHIYLPFRGAGSGGAYPVSIG